jgi:hypothetical protein
MRRATTLMALLGGCGISYDAGSYRVRGIGPFPPTRVTLDCLDLGIGLDPAGSRRFPQVRYQLGNGCERAIRVDLSSVRAEGRDVQGNRVALMPMADPSWVAPRELAARWFARELIAYEPVSGPADPLREICLDVGQVNAARGGTEHWVCLAVGGAS